MSEVPQIDSEDEEEQEDPLTFSSKESDVDIMEKVLIHFFCQQTFNLYLMVVIYITIPMPYIHSHMQHYCPNSIFSH